MMRKVTMMKGRYKNKNQSLAALEDYLRPV